MKLKCIGGPCDGQNELIDRKYIRIGDAVNVINHARGDYTEIWFLRPDNLTMFDCIQLQFLK